MEVIAILLLAIAFDLAFGEPPDRLHPVAWLGKLIVWEMKIAPRQGEKRQYFWGALCVLLTAAAIAAGIYYLFAFLQTLHPAIFIAAAAIILKMTFSLRGLAQAAKRVKRHISDDKSAAARRDLRALVSRDTANLETPQVVNAAVASVAENSCDSFTAPLFYFTLFGLPGAAAYRIINTFDAMVGYRGEYEHLGKFAARLDDAVNFIPARLTALLMVAAAWCCRHNPREAWRIMRRDHKLTASPNGGWTMSAAAGALGMQIEKAGYYRLGDGADTVPANVIDRSVNLMLATAAIWCAATITIEVIRIVIS